MRDGAGRLGWVEAGRGLAACLVMASHAYVVRPVPIDPNLTDRLGVIGVGFFFVLSGFIMVHVHGNDVGHPDRVASFAWRRLVRIWPTYWVVLVIAWGVNRLQQPAVRVHADAGWLWRQGLIWPGGPPFVGPAWTLRHELLFYLLFGILLADRRAGFVLMGAWTVACLMSLIQHGMPAGAVVTWPDLVFHPLNLSFPLGMALGGAVRAGWGDRFVVAAAVLGVALLLLPGPAATAMGSAFCYAGVLGLLVRLPTEPRWPGPSFLWLGAISYSLYLLHLSVFTLLRGVIGQWPAADPHGALRVVGQMAAALLAAGLFHAVFERPVLRWLGGRRTVFGLRVGRPGPARHPVAVEVAARA